MSWNRSYTRIVQFNKERSLPRQIAAAIAEDIYTGKLNVGDYLPTILDLAVLNGISRSTVSTAYKELRKLGIADLDFSKRHVVASKRKIYQLLY